MIKGNTKSVKKIKSVDFSASAHFKAPRKANWSLGQRRLKRGMTITFKNTRYNSFEI
jgi:hypothetical protein